MSDNKNIIKISDYYKDFDIPEIYYNNNNLRNLLELTVENDIHIFSSNNKKLKIKSKKKILKECNNKKKIKLKEFSKELDDYNTNTVDINSSYLEGTNNKYINNIKSIDNIIKILDTDFHKLVSIQNDKFIETYSNI